MRPWLTCTRETLTGGSHGPARTDHDDERHATIKHRHAVRAKEDATASTAAALAGESLRPACK